MKFSKFIAEKVKIASALTLFAGLTCASPTYAYDWFISNAKVTLINATFTPTIIEFYVNAPGGSCPAGATLTYQPPGTDEISQQTNVNAMLAVLTTSLVAGRSINVYGFNNGCTISFIQLI